MKKTLMALLFGAAMILALWTPVCAAASGSFGVDSTTVVPGATFTVTVSIHGAEKVERIGIIPSYDRSAFEFVSGQWLVSGALSESDLSKTGAAILAFNGNEAVNGSVYSFTLQVKDTASGSYSIGGTVDIGTPLAVSSTSVSVGVSVPVSCTHSFTKQNVTDAFKKSDATCYGAAVYYYVCEYCGAASTSKTYTYGEKLAHSFTREVADEKYKLFDATCQNKATYVKSCVCGAKGTDVFTAGEIGNHRYTKTVASDEYLCSYATCYTAAVYYKSCECGKKGIETFEHGKPLGHSYEYEWRSNEDSHWQKCIMCSHIAKKEKHNPGPAADEYNDQVCRTCGYIIASALGHTHTYDPDVWEADSSVHWNYCECGEVFNVSEHVWENEQVIKFPSLTEEGVLEYTCTCGMKRTEWIDKLLPETDEPAEIPEEVPEETTSDEPAESPEEVPEETTSGEPAESPAEVPEETTSDELAENPEEVPTEAPIEIPADIPAEEPTEESTENSPETPNDEETKLSEPRDKSSDKLKLVLVLIIGLGFLGSMIVIFVVNSKK